MILFNILLYISILIYSRNSSNSVKYSKEVHCETNTFPTGWSHNEVFLYIASVAGVLTFSDFFPPLDTFEVSEVMPEITTLTLGVLFDKWKLHNSIISVKPTPYSSGCIKTFCFT